MSPTTDALLAPATIEQLRQQARQLSRHLRQGSSHLSGPLVSNQRGAGMELEDLRPYQTGDDIRHIAWRASARSLRPISKVFRAERQPRILLLVEQHPGMNFATRGELKAALASRCASLLSFAALHQGAPIGGLLIRQHTEHFSPGTTRARVEQLINACNQMPGYHPPADPRPALRHLQRMIRRDDRIYLISDFQHWDTSLTPLLSEINQYRNIQALQVIDEGEQQLPALGKLRLRSPFDGQEHVVDTLNPALTRQYAQAMSQQQQNLQQLLHHCAIPRQSLFTDQDPAATLLGPR